MDSVGFERMVVMVIVVVVLVAVVVELRGWEVIVHIQNVGYQ